MIIIIVNNYQLYFGSNEISLWKLAIITHSIALASNLLLCITLACLLTLENVSVIYMILLICV